MRFLVDANMPLSVAPRIRAFGHEATDVREIGIGAADDSVIARHARENGLSLVTRDKDFGDIRNYPPADYAGIVVLDLPNDIGRGRCFASYGSVCFTPGMAGAIAWAACSCRTVARALPSKLINADARHHRQPPRKRSSERHKIKLVRPNPGSRL